MAFFSYSYNGDSKLVTLCQQMVLQKYNMFVAQIGCAAFGVLAFLIFGPGWLARAAALAASIAFMIVTGSTHPPGMDDLNLLQSQFIYIYKILQPDKYKRVITDQIMLLKCANLFTHQIKTCLNRH